MTNMNVLQAEKDKKKKNEKINSIHTKMENVEEIDFNTLFESDLPPESKQLIEDSKKDEREVQKDKDVKKIIKNVEEKYRKVLNMVPKDDSVRNALKIDNNLVDFQDNKRKTNIAAKARSKKADEDLLKPT